MADSAVKRVAILSPGLIGGSIGLGLAAYEPGIEVVCWARRASSSATAVALGAAHGAASTPEEAVQGADAVFVCCPVGAVGDLLARIARRVGSGCVVLDVAGVKRPVADWSRTLSQGAFVGSHPMAGSERSGIEFASADLYHGATWVFTPLEGDPPWAVDRALALAEALGARPLICTVEEHDRWAAALSHLPHLLAYALAQVAQDRVPCAGARMAGGSYRDGARVAASSPAAWAEILIANRHEAAEACAAASAWLAGAAAALGRDDAAALTGLLEPAHAGRLEVG
ncbi:MAG: prephenate dehydrogenase/arogenate dehydrogenase family protein [Armatimonadetes bacterium]|nr:prephenate dehydrogenase/arogenate dehydrogenase family protein [Armatimonadota bacterium]